MQSKEKAGEVLEALLNGNKRFYEGSPSRYHPEKMMDLEAHVNGQNPYAVVLGCSDSRVPVEMIFDQTVGDLFVIRVAGNVADRTQVGSVEYAVEVLNTPLIMVLGHSGCGAVTAAWQAYKSGEMPASPHLQSILQFILPAIQSYSHREKAEAGVLPAGLIRHNVVETMTALTRQSTLIQRRIETGQLLLVGAEYSLHTGRVDVFAGLPEDDFR